MIAGKITIGDQQASRVTIAMATVTKDFCQDDVLERHMPNFGDKIIVSVSTIYANYATQFYSCSKEKSPKKSSTVSIHCLENEPYILKHFHACSAHNDLLYLSAVFENKNTHYLGWLEPSGNGETRFCFSVRLKKQYCCLPVVAINAIT